MGNISLKSESSCVGCGACIAICSQHAISLKKVSFGATIPYIDKTLCINCGKCVKVCYAPLVHNTLKKDAYIFINKNKEQLLKSASGGAFSALAAYILSIGGIVFGCELSIKRNNLEAIHSRIDNISELPRILGSKYVNSNCVEAYKLAKVDLDRGRIVLFSGRSCQINGLYSFLGKKVYENLYTVDLICHGVPGELLFQDYIHFLENKLKGQILQFSFRVKRPGKIEYKESIVYKEYKTNNIKQTFIPMLRSYYYKLFMLEENYRMACYSCPFATLNKPSDITIGDYFEAKDDYPNLFEGPDAIDASNGISSIIIHTEKGRFLLNRIRSDNRLVEVDPIKVKDSHKQLNQPGSYTNLRNRCIKIYDKKGYAGIHQYFIIQYVTRIPFAIVKRVLVRTIKFIFRLNYKHSN